MLHLGPIGLFNSVSGYAISSAALFGGTTSDYLSRTFGSGGDRKTWTLSFWVLRESFGTLDFLFDGAPAGTRQTGIRFDNGNTISAYEYNGSTFNYNLSSSGLYRDPNWMHIVLEFDATNTSQKLYVNGEEVSYGANSNPSNADHDINNNVAHYLGRSINYTGQEFSGYMAEVVFIDGTALDPTSFGEFNSGRWEPKAYTGTYGTNGFYLKFEDGALGTDSSGNGNDWTVNGTVTVVTNTPTDVYSVFNRLDPRSDVASWLTGNTIVAIANSAVIGTLFFDSGKIVVEQYATLGTGATIAIGLIDNDPSADFSVYQRAYTNDGHYWKDGVDQGVLGATYANFDNIRIEADIDAGTISFYKNDALQFTATSQSLSGKAWTHYAGAYGTVNQSGLYLVTDVDNMNGAVTSGFEALTSSNLPEVTGVLSDHFVQGTYTGNGTSQTINFTDAQGNAVDWGNDDYLLVAKNTGDTTASTDSWIWSDTVRGITKYLSSDGTGAETTDATMFSSSNGTSFSVGAGNNTNRNTDTITYYAFKAGTEVTNTDGTISAQVSANQDLGFSIVTYTGNGVNGATIGHNLGQEVGCIITKRLDTASNWQVYHVSTGATGYMNLNQTIPFTSSSGPYNNTEPTSSLQTLGTFGDINASGGTYVAYVFAKDSPFLKCYNFSGNLNADGPFVNLNGEPIWDMAKNADTNGTNYVQHDAARTPNNVSDKFLTPNTNSAEFTGTSTSQQIDRVATGRKSRSSGIAGNGSGDNIVGVSVVDPIGSNRMPRGE